MNGLRHFSIFTSIGRPTGVTSAKDILTEIVGRKQLSLWKNAHNLRARGDQNIFTILLRVLIIFVDLLGGGEWAGIQTCS
jgi:hypothetical protein